MSTGPLTALRNLLVSLMAVSPAMPWDQRDVLGQAARSDPRRAGALNTSGPIVAFDW